MQDIISTLPPVVWGSFILLLIVVFLLLKSNASFKAKNHQLETQKQETSESLYALREINAKNEVEIRQLNERITIKRENLGNLEQKYLNIVEDRAKILTTLEQRQRNFNEQMQLIDGQKEQLRHQFEAIASEVLTKKEKIFSEQNQQTITNLLTPFREQISNFRKKVEDIHQEDTKQNIILKTELGTLQALNQKITKEASDLTEALRGNKKMQGNWGELILENVLEQAGLQHDKDYTTQKAYESPEGKRQLPDVVINLPHNKHLIIDAKVSLNAYVDSINSIDEALIDSNIRTHIQNIKRHIDDLASKHYPSAKGLNSPEIVIMFIPIEPAFIAAFKNDATLLQYALSKNILVATPVTLLASLTLVKQLWRLENQSKNTEQLAELAGSVYDKLRTFLESMDQIENALTNAQEAYNKARGQLLSGRGNLIKLSDDFLELGVSVRKEISKQWLDEGRIEMEPRVAIKQSS